MTLQRRKDQRYHPSIVCWYQKNSFECHLIHNGRWNQGHLEHFLVHRKCLIPLKPRWCSSYFDQRFQSRYDFLLSVSRIVHLIKVWLSLHCSIGFLLLGSFWFFLVFAFSSGVYLRLNVIGTIPRPSIVRKLYFCDCFSRGDIEWMQTSSPNLIPFSCCFSFCSRWFFLEELVQIVSFIITIF